MKIISFAMLLAVSAMFLSCDTSTNANDVITARCKTAAKPNYEDLDQSCKSEQSCY
jgi:hypothetical protein